MEDKAHEEIYEDRPDAAETGSSLGNEENVPDLTEEADREDVPPDEVSDGADGGQDAGDSDGADETDRDIESSSDGEEAASGMDSGPEPASDGKWHVFGKKKEKKDPKDQKIEELTDQLKRQMAEFDNFRKRTEKEKSAMFEVGARSIIEKMLPVIDNFERGLATVPEDAKGTPFAEGMDMIYKQLLKNLEEAGVKPIEAVGQPFDPNFHNAVMHVEDENLGENVVAQEFQKGYMYRDTVVRHSMVQVAN